MTQDNANMIDDETTTQIRALTDTPQLLRTNMERFIILEPKCANDIATLVEGASRTLFAMLKEEGTYEMSMDDVIDIASKYGCITTVVEAIFGAGLIYGTARYRQEFERYWGQALIKTANEQISGGRINCYDAF